MSASCTGTKKKDYETRAEEHREEKGAPSKAGSHHPLNTLASRKETIEIRGGSLGTVIIGSFSGENVCNLV